MPYLVMEYSHSVEERVNVPGLLEDLHYLVLSSGLFESASVKSRAQRCQHWLVGKASDDADFIHIDFDLLAGRSAQQKRVLSEQLMAVLLAKAGQIESLTVNVRDMDKDAFQKVTHSLA